MTDELDRALRGTLATAARKAPDTGPDLLERVTAGHRVRRRRRASAAALAVALIVGGTGAAGVTLRSGDGTPGVAAGGELTRVSLTELGEPVKVRERWPAAVRSIPADLPDGSPLHPITLTDGDTLLAATTSSFERTDRLWAFDLGTREARVIADVSVPRRSTTYPSDFTVGEGQIVWWLSYTSDDGDVAEIWAAPVAGGAARKVTGMPGTSLSKLTIAGRDVVWSTGDGVYKAPLSGGSAQKIPGTEGYQIVAWPWIGAPASVKESGDVKFRSLRDVRTGERRKAALGSFQGAWACAVTWCLGTPMSGAAPPRDPATAVQRRDGRAGRTLPLNELPPPEDLLYDRFFPYLPAGLRSENHILYDVETGRLLDTGIPRGNRPLVVNPRRDARHAQIFMSTEDGLTLVDLSEIR